MAASTCADFSRFLGSDEDIERRGEGRAARALLATHGDVEAHAVALADGGRHRDVLGLRGRAVVGASGDRDVELARQVRERLVAQKDPLELRRDSRGVDELVGSEAGRRTADDAADVVHPGLQAGQPGGFETRDDARNLLDRQPAELDLLARGDVGHVAATRSRDLGEQAKLTRREDSVGHADPHHEVAGGRPAEKDTDPLQALLVVVADRLPAFASEPGEVLGDVEAVAGGLEGLDLVHAPTSATRRSRTAHAFNSGCCEIGSRAVSVRLLAAL